MLLTKCFKIHVQATADRPHVAVSAYAVALRAIPVHFTKQTEVEGPFEFEQPVA